MSKRTNPFARAIEQPAPQAVTNPYQELYDLGQNPFPTSPTIQPMSSDRRSNGELYNSAVRAAEERDFEQKFLNPVPGDEVHLGLLRYGGAPYARGQGKSAFLYYLTRKVHRARREDGNDCLAVFLQPQSRTIKKFWQILRLTWKYLGQPVDSGSPLTQLEEADQLLRAQALTKLLPSKKLQELSALEPAEAARLLNSPQNISETLNIQPTQLAAEIQKLIEMVGGMTINPIFADVLYAAEFSLAKTWSVVERWSENRWRRDGATALLDGLAAALIASGFRRLFIFFDQYETVFLYQNATDRSEFLDGLRGSIFDADTISARYQFLYTILVIHPKIIDQVSPLWARVGLDRFCPIIGPHADKNAITLCELDVPQLRTLLTGYLDAFRAPEDPQRTSIHPFTKAAFEALVAQSQGIAGYLLSYAHFILAEAMQAKKEEVSEEIVNKVGLERPIETLDTVITSVSLPDSDVDLSSNNTPGK